MSLEWAYQNRVEKSSNLNVIKLTELIPLNQWFWSKSAAILFLIHIWYIKAKQKHLFNINLLSTLNIFKNTFKKMITGFDPNIPRSSDFGIHFAFMQIRWSKDTTYLGKTVELGLGTSN